MGIIICVYLTSAAFQTHLKEANAFVSKGFLKPKPSCVKGLGIDATTEGGGTPPAAPR